MGEVKGLAIFALILGAFGVLLGGYIFYNDYILNPGTDETKTKDSSPEIEDILFDSDGNNYYVTSTYIAIPGLHILIPGLEEGQTVYVIFEAQAVLRDSGSTEAIHVRLATNDNAITETWTQVADRVAPGGVIRHSITLQYSWEASSDGDCNITIQSSGSGTLGVSTGNYLTDNTLFVIIYN